MHDRPLSFRRRATAAGCAATAAVVSLALAGGAEALAGVGVALALRCAAPPSVLARCVRLLGRRRSAGRAPDPTTSDLLEGLAARAGRRVPHLELVAGEEIEARVIAGGPGDAVLVSEGLERLDPAERAAVLAHELGHLRGRDGALVGAVVLAAAFCLLAAVLPALGHEPALERLRRLSNMAGGTAADATVLASVAANLAFVAACAFAGLRLWLGPRLERAADDAAVALLGTSAGLVAALGHRRAELVGTGSRALVDGRVRRLAPATGLDVRSAGCDPVPRADARTIPSGPGGRASAFRTEAERDGRARAGPGWTERVGPFAERRSR